MEEVESDTVRMMQLRVELTELMWVDDIELLTEQTLQPTTQQQTPESIS